MKVEIKNNKYYFYYNESNLMYAYSYTPYPSCCLSGIIHEFIMYNRGEFNKHKKEIQEYTLQLMKQYSINQLLVSDIKGGGGYSLCEDLENAKVIDMSFNKNSSNFVYLFSIYKER